MPEHLYSVHVFIIMKYRVCAIAHILVLVVFISRPAIPYIEYAVFNDYIAKNLCINKDKPKSCCHGKCYLEKQLKKAAEGTDAAEHSTNKKVSQNEVKEFLCAHFMVPQATETRLPQRIYNQTTTLPQFACVIFVPPKPSEVI